MASANGDAGNSTTIVFGDKVTVVGDNPNTHPAVYTDPTGFETNAYGFSGSSGLIHTKTAVPTFTPIDNASDFHGGTYTITAMNAIHFESGGGGLSADINGSINLSSWGGLINITSTNQTSVQAQVVKLTATNTILFSGPTLYVDTAETIFNRNVTFGNNVIINGGLAINGELFAPHLTTVRSVGFTGESETLYGYPINLGTFCASIIPDPATLPPGTVTPENGIMSGIPYRFVIMQDPVTALDPKPFIAIPPHEHLYDGVATKALNSYSEFNEAMKQAESDEPVEAQPNFMQDMQPSELLKKIQKKVQKRITKFIKEVLGFS